MWRKRERGKEIYIWRDSEREKAKWRDRERQISI